MNQPVAPFPGAANAMYPNHRYGNRGPERVRGNRARAQEGPPESIADHIDSALSKIQGLNPRQRLAIHNVMLEKCRDLHFAKLIADQLGPWSKAAVQDEGRPL
jgi:hypothetical protein